MLQLDDGGVGDVGAEAQVNGGEPTAVLRKADDGGVGDRAPSFRSNLANTSTDFRLAPTRIAK